MDLGNLEHILIAFSVSVLAIIAIINPFSVIPQYLSITDGMQKKDRQKLFRIMVYTAFIIVILFTITGPYIMKYLFKIEIRDLRMAGGLVLVVMGLKNLVFPNGGSRQGVVITPGEPIKEIVKNAIIPMAFPMLVGPGTLTTLIVIATDTSMALTLLAALFSFIFMLGLLHFSASIEKVVGKLALHVLARIMQVFIIAIGVKLIMIGLKDALVFLQS